MRTGNPILQNLWQPNFEECTAQTKRSVPTKRLSHDYLQLAEQKNKTFFSVARGAHWYKKVYAPEARYYCRNIFQGRVS